MTATAQWVEHDVLPSAEYPETDGKPMAENTTQYEWIVMIRENLDALLDNAFVAADLFWYPVKGQPGIVQAPDCLVAFNRPKGHRRSYRTWMEGGVVPQVVFEVLSPSNILPEMVKKLRFYDEHGVEEYYVWDPDNITLNVYIRDHGALLELLNPPEFRSPALGVTFLLTRTGLTILDPQGQPFRSFKQITDALAEEKAATKAAKKLASQARTQAASAERKAQEAQLQAQEAQLQAQEAQLQAQTAQLQAQEALLQVQAAQLQAQEAQLKAQDADARAQALAAKLRALGIDP